MKKTRKENEEIDTHLGITVKFNSFPWEFLLITFIKEQHAENEKHAEIMII